MQTEIIKVKGDWQEVVNDCRSTVGKTELGREPSARKLCSTTSSAVEYRARAKCRTPPNLRSWCGTFRKTLFGLCFAGLAESRWENIPLHPCRRSRAARTRSTYGPIRTNTPSGSLRRSWA